MAVTGARPSAADPVRAIADAVLYEGYVLWPYRRSALKNQQRWTFGGVYPRAHAETRSAGDDPWTMQTECLVEGDPARVSLTVSVRFLHVVWRQVVDAAGVPVDELRAGDERWLTWEEAREREIASPRLTLARLMRGVELPIVIGAGGTDEVIRAADGSRAGGLTRAWDRLEGRLLLRAVRLADGLHRLTARIENMSPWEGGSRAAALRRTFCSTHTVLRVSGGAFPSMTDPPPGLEDAAAACENEGTWPVLVGEEGDRTTLLSSPILLEEYPRVAPESPGDLFDGGEIDQLLVLNIMSLTEEEKTEMRATDPRVREVLDRTEALTPEQQTRLHGTIRELQARRR